MRLIPNIDTFLKCTLELINNNKFGVEIYAAMGSCSLHQSRILSFLPQHTGELCLYMEDFDEYI